MNEPASRQKWTHWLITRKAVKRLLVLLALIVAVLVWAYFSMIRMPGRSHAGPLPPLTAEHAALRDALQRDVQRLAGEIGPRDVWRNHRELVAAANWIEASLQQAGHHEVKRQPFQVSGVTVENLEVEISGSSRGNEIVVIGAHYDSVPGCPAANDNGSGVAATLALARMFAPESPGGPGDTSASPSLARAGGGISRTLRFVFFTNEEPPYFQTEEMGSRVYARRCKERGEHIVAMISLETIGYYSDAPNSQRYPIKPIGWLYPSTGHFIGFVGNWASRGLVRQAIGAFRAHAAFPSQGAALPGWITGVDWSDHWSFWQEGYEAIMVTDTAPFRYLHYHGPDDTPEKLDYQRMARVVDGLRHVVQRLVQ